MELLRSKAATTVCRIADLRVDKFGFACGGELGIRFQPANYLLT
jgi:hypothetical protein